MFLVKLKPVPFFLLVFLVCLWFLLVLLVLLFHFLAWSSQLPFNDSSRMEIQYCIFLSLCIPITPRAGLCGDVYRPWAWGFNGSGVPALCLLQYVAFCVWDFELEVDSSPLAEPVQESGLDTIKWHAGITFKICMVKIHPSGDTVLVVGLVLRPSFP